MTRHFWVPMSFFHFYFSFSLLLPSSALPFYSEHRQRPVVFLGTRSPTASSASTHLIGPSQRFHVRQQFPASIPIIRAVTASGGRDQQQRCHHSGLHFAALCMLIRSYLPGLLDSLFAWFVQRLVAICSPSYH